MQIQIWGQLNTMSMLTVSVVIPAYNEASRIERSIQSVLKQIRPVDEIIVVDDGSTDDTAIVAGQYGKRISFFRQENQGPAAARNKGIQHARSAWIAFLDADDEWLPDHIENACKILGQHPEIVWYCAAYRLPSEITPFSTGSREVDRFVEDGVINNYFLAQAKTNFSRPSSMLVQKYIFDEVGMFNVEFSHGEDLDLWFRIALRYPRIAYSNLPGCIYWRREGSITTREKKVDIPRFLRRIETTYASSTEFSESTRRESDYLVRAWVTGAIKDAIKQKDKQSLVRIKEKFDELLPIRWKWIRWLFQNSMLLEIFPFVVTVLALQAGDDVAVKSKIGLSKGSRR